MDQEINQSKKIQLFLQQKEMLDTFLKTHAIDQNQYNKSYQGLIDKMGIDVEELKKEGLL